MPWKSKEAAAKWKKENPDWYKRNAENERKRTAAKKAGRNVDGLDFDHATGKFVEPSVNRSRPSEQNAKKKRKPKK